MPLLNREAASPTLTSRQRRASRGTTLGRSNAGWRARGLRALVVLGVLVSGAALASGPAAASQLVDRDGQNVSLKIDGQGHALLAYTKHGQRKHVLVWGAVNALAPSTQKKQVAFQLDYSGNQVKGFTGTCGHYDGPALANVVAACKAADGSYWAVQEWPQPLPDLGYPPWLPEQKTLSMDVSHWTGAVAQLVAYPDWVYSGTFHSLFGRYTYNGSPIYGFGTTSVGVPTDTYGRLVYLDTYGSTYGAGWARENSFVSHNPTGVFCYGFYKFDPTKGGYVHPPGQTDVRGPGTGSKYRLIAIGPGVTPDVTAGVDDQGDFDAKSADKVAFRLKEWKLFSTFIGQDKQCRQGRALGAINVTVEKSWFSGSPGGDGEASFTLKNPLYFNFKFAQAPPASNGKLTSAKVRWSHPGSFNATNLETTDVTVSSDGLVASAPFTLKNPNNKRYVGTWTATLVLNGLVLAQATIDAALDPSTLVNISPPVITGALTVGTTLTVSPGTWSFVPARYTYSWTRFPAQGGSGVNLSSTASYTLTAADVGWRISVFVTAYTSTGKVVMASAFLGRNDLVLPR
jgi:hypothetical protein